MKKKILIVGKNSFIGSSLYFFLRKKLEVKICDYNTFKNFDYKTYKNFNLIINCASNLEYIKNRYNLKNDFDYQIANKIKKLDCKMILLSSRKVYQSQDNIKEFSKILPRDNYSKNKVITEKIISNLLGQKVLILRISNIIGCNLNSLNKRKVHYTFMDYFLKCSKEGVFYKNQSIYKDFLPLNKFCEIVLKLINKKNIYGAFNISIGKRVYLKKLVEWLNFYNPNSIKYVNLPNNVNKDCFYLNNSKLLYNINVKLDIDDLKKYCKKLSKKIFLNK